jgi:hypothetical protein
MFCQGRDLCCASVHASPGTPDDERPLSTQNSRVGLPSLPTLLTPKYNLTEISGSECRTLCALIKYLHMIVQSSRSIKEESARVVGFE